MLANPPDSSGQAQRPSSVRRILVVDDDPDSADTLGMLLEIEGHQVSAVYSAADALAHVDSFAPDIVLLDIGLPGMDGYDVARQIRSRPNPPTLIAVSGYGQPEDRERSAEAGFSAHVVKPVDIAVLRKVING